MDKDKSNEKESEKEVSLPGTGETEQTILEVFNSNLVNTSDDTTVNISLSSSSPPPLVENSEHIENDRNHRQNINESTTNESQSVEHSSASVKNVDIVDTGGNTNDLIQQKQLQSDNKDTKVIVDTDATINPEVLVTDTKFESDVKSSEKSTPTTTKKIQDSSNKEKEQQQNDNPNNTKVLDIESHLIETFENYSVNESDQSGVSVNEVPPAQEELLKPSTIESDNSIKTVIEIEPRTPILHKTIKTNINVIPNLPKVEFNSSANKNLTKNSESSNTSKSVSNEINLIDEVLNNDNILKESKAQEKLTSKIEKSEDTVPVSPHIEEESTGKSNLNLKTSEKIEEKESEKQISNIASHIEEKTLEEKKENESINSQNLKEEKSQVNNQKSQKDLYSDLKSPALLLHLIESTFGKPSETEKETQDNSKTENQVIQPTSTEEKSEVSKSDKKITIETVQNTETNVPKEVSKDTDKNKVESNQNLGINGLSVASPEEEEAKKSFLESIPQLEESPSSSAAASRYYQSLREYLDKKEASPPPVPIQTYRWEDLRRAKEKGGYPWTHLYKRPLGPDEEPEIVLLLRKSQELRLPSESPRSLKKVRIHDQVLVKETERYISDLSDTEDVTETEDTKSAQSENTSLSESEDKPSKLNKIKGILKRNRPPKLNIQLTKENGEVNSNNKSENSPKRAKCCHPIMDKLKIMADKQLKKRHIKKIPLKKDERIILMEEQKILKLKLSPKAERSEIPHFIEKRDSDEILEDDKMEIVELDESPSKARKRREQLALKEDSQSSSVLIPDEIIEIPQPMQVDEAEKSKDITQSSVDSTIAPEVTEEEIKAVKSSPPKKSPRKKKEHVYEDIDESLGSKIDEILEEAVVSVLKQSLVTQDQSAVKDLEVKPKLEEMGSSEETEDRQVTHLAPISSIDSTSSEEEKKQHLAPLVEESDQGEQASIKEEILGNLNTVEDNELNSANEIKSVLKREPSPSISDKKVTFSHVEDESEPHREDIELPEQFKPPLSRWSKMR